MSRPEAGRLPWGLNVTVALCRLMAAIGSKTVAAASLLKRTFLSFFFRQGAQSFLVLEDVMPAERFDFVNAQGQRLAALLDTPAGEPRAYALFAHCFTCGKDVHAARRIAQALTALDIAVLRFDFTGLGSSEGEFANTTFSSNVADLVAAAGALRRAWQAPAILIGHSLGGTAVLAAAADVPEARAVVTIGAPSDPAHVTGLFKDRLDEIGAKGEVAVALAGREFRISRGFVDDLAQHKLLDRVANLHKALLIFHSPTDEVVGIDNASRIFI